MAGEPGTEIITATANGLYPDYPKAKYIFARRKGENLRSEFIAAVEPHGGRSRITGIERLELSPPEGAVTPVAVKISGADGVVDYIFSAADDTLRRTSDGFSFAGRFAHVRIREGEVEAVTAAGVRELSGPGWDLAKTARSAAFRAPSPSPPAGSHVQSFVHGWSGTIDEIDPDRNMVTTKATLPVDGTLAGSVIYFGNPVYTRNTAYRILRVERSGGGSRIFLHASVGLGIGRVGSIIDGQTLTSVIPHEYANSVRGGNGSGFLNGKRVRSAPGAATAIVSVRYGNPMTLKVASTAGFKPGDMFFYDDLQAGDSFAVPAIFYFARK